MMVIRRFVKLVGILGMISSAYAQSEFEEIEVLDRPRFTLTDKFTFDLDVTFLPLDAYYKPILLEGSISYQFTDWVAFEPIRFGYSVYNHDTGFTDSLKAIAPAGTRIEDQKLKETKYKVGSSVFLNMLYSKSNWFNKLIAYHYWQIGAGFSYYELETEHQTALDLMMRVRFFLTESTTFNLRAGHSIGFSDKAPQNITFIGLGVGLAY